MVRPAPAALACFVMGAYALPLFARLRQNAGVDARTVDAVIAFVLLATSLALLTTLPGVIRPGSLSPAAWFSPDAVAIRRRMPLAATTTALVGLVGYELSTHDGYGAVPPVAVALTFYTVGRSGAAHRQRPLTGLVAGLGLAGSAIVSTAVDASAGAVFLHGCSWSWPRWRWASCSRDAPI